VVAEGIETVDELSALVDVGAQHGQGFLFARPAFPLPGAKWPGAESLSPETSKLPTAARLR
jgi:EAL domain-containing protein (putative c-di-GMP-specific phosphodiesterase class I)